MAREIKDLQKLIDKRASEKLKADLRSMEKVFTCHPLLLQDEAFPKLAYFVSHTAPGEPGETVVMKRPDLIFRISPYVTLETDEGFMGQLYRYWLPIYMKRESEELIQKVDQLANDVQNLLDNRPQ